MSFYYGDQSWPQLEAAIKKDTMIIIPVGTTEEHGRHLPIETDALIAEMYGNGFGNALEGLIPVLVTRPIYFGYSMNIVENWPGTLKIRTRVFMDYIFDMKNEDLASLFTFAKKVAKAIRKVIPCERIGITVIGLEVPHAHVHLIPINFLGDMNFEKPKLRVESQTLQDLAQEIAEQIED